MFSVLKARDYRLLFAGQAVSHIGDQFHIIALPWLVLSLTQDPMQLGLVLAVAGIPRAALMLMGGAWADRCSPRTIMLVSDLLRLGVTALLATAILTGTVQVWMVYALALVFGVVSGFFMPAAQSAVPRLLDDGQLESGNALIMGVNQLGSFVGPAAAGLLIAAFGANSLGGEEAASLVGIGSAFVLDAASFLVSAILLAFMGRIPAANAHSEARPIADIVEGLRYASRNENIRWMVLTIAAANFLVAGPMFVGLPVLAQSQLTGGAAGLGVVLSAYGLGSLLGMIGAGAAPRPSADVFSRLIVALMVGFAATMGSLAFVTATWLAAVLMLVTGVGNGYIGITLMTSVQRSTDQRFLGRVMSLIMLAVVGLMPLSQALAGFVMGASPTALFVGAGAGFACLAVVTSCKRSVWAMQESPLSYVGGGVQG
ncbi:MAG: MFS transporter [Coriobacteriia bacterium]|nr:MFS transporter [Coriobacteriia bacterium]